jgi:hypothetical protein
LLLCVHRIKISFQILLSAKLRREEGTQRIVNVDIFRKGFAKLNTEMYRRVLFFVLILLTQESFAMPSDSMPLVLSGRQLQKMDTFGFTWNGGTIGKAYPKATMHLWIDHLESGRRWKFRYPILNGETSGDLLITDSLPAGNYALNFMATEQFFEVRGRVKSVKMKMAYNHQTKKRDTIAVFETPRLTGKEMGYTMLNRMSDILQDDILQVDREGFFKMPPIVFGDSVQLLFDPGRGRGVYFIDIVTPLDSSFTPFYSETVFIRVGSDTVITATDTTNYQFGFADTYTGEMLPEVKVRGRSNAQKFEEDYVSKMFRGGAIVKTFEGLDSDEIARTNNIWLFLQSKVPGLVVRQDLVSTFISWRGDAVSVFLNEFPVRPFDVTIAPMDVALIKVYAPPAMVGSFITGGAIAIYTKRGAYENRPGNPQYNFMVKGYTHGETRWK